MQHQLDRSTVEDVSHSESELVGLMVVLVHGHMECEDHDVALSVLVLRLRLLYLPVYDTIRDEVD